MGPPGSKLNPTFRFHGKTVLFYDTSHGNQVEYYGEGGRCYLWYPGNRVVLAGEWRVDEEFLYFRYGKNTYNPVTGQRGGGWERARLRGYGANVVEAVEGDPLNLADRGLPYRLLPHPPLQSIAEAKVKSEEAKRSAS
ncbi:MAG: hypothetical protein QM820_06515 [Minicystis sp.]